MLSNRRVFIGVLLLFCTLSKAYSAERPNIVLIFTDDQGMNDVGCYGSSIPTPHIDSLARDGVRFTSWYAASSICTPSRFGLLTGRFPSRSQDELLSALMFLSDEHKDKGIRPQETTIAHVLNDSGYDTALIGKWHLGHGHEKFWPTKHGFDTFFGHTGGCVDYFTMRYGIQKDWYRNRVVQDLAGYATDTITEDAVRFLSKRDSGNPFFLMLAYNAPHFGKGYNYSKKEAVNIMQPRAVDLARVGDGFDDVTRRQFAAMTMRLDDGVGEVLDAIDENGLRKNTLVIFMTDHGGDPVYGGSNKPFRGQKATLFEGGIRVPCLMRWPEKFDAGKTVHAVAGAIDFFPTFCQIAGVDSAKYQLDGQNFLPAVQKGKTAEREMFWQLGAHQELERKPWVALRKGDWKYLNSPHEGEFLFNLKSDPYEQRNLANSNLSQFKAMLDRSNELLVELKPK